jgi:D-glycero-alpha-D-manno-heptose-7-phosphate kinase
MNFQSCLAIAPLRVSFVGGGTDFSEYFLQRGGAVISTAISKYVYVHVKRHDPLFQERYRIAYSDVEHTQTRDAIQNQIVKKSLEFLNMDEPLQISTSSDLPAASGLGSSSSFTVALLFALHSLNGEKVSPLQLAEEACHIEIELLKSPIGKQDQYAAAFGGMNFIEFLTNGNIKIEPLMKDNKSFEALITNSFLIWTNQTRNANQILSDQVKNMEKNYEYLDSLRELSYQFKYVIQNDPSDLAKIGQIISKSWELKVKLSNLIDLNSAQEIFKFAMEKSHGSKLLGAGGGGFVLTILKNATEIDSFIGSGFRTIPLSVDMSGAKILSLSN